MAETGFSTLAEWASRRAPNGTIADIVNVLSQRNDILQDMLWTEGNLPTGHLITQAGALPSGSWRRFNEGRAAVTTTTEQFTETCGMLGAESKVDVALAKLNGDPAGYRTSRDNLVIEGLSQQFAGAVFYSSVSTNPEQVHGLAPRYYSTTAGDAADNVLASSSVASATCESIWLINWAPNKVYGIYPKGSMAGLQVQDKGEQRVLDASGNAFYAYVTNFEWHCGIAVEDWRYAVRYQWDPADTECADDDRGIYLAMQDMLGTIHDRTGNLRFYMSRTSERKLRAQLASNDYNPLTQWQNGQNGKLVDAFSGVPLRICDQLIPESVLVA